MIAKFWHGVERLKQKDEQKRTHKIAGAALTEAALDDELESFTEAVAASMITTSVAIATILAISQVSEENQEDVFIFRTEGDDRVCPICEPLDGEIMKESNGTLLLPPLHNNCRCMLDVL